MAQKPHNPRSGPTRKSDLEAARAQNLRANLLRRKAQVNARAESDQDNDMQTPHEQNEKTPS